MKEISRKDFVTLLTAGMGTLYTFFLAGWLPRSKSGPGIAESYDLIQASLLPEPAGDKLPPFEFGKDEIKSTAKYAAEQFDSGFN